MGLRSRLAFLHEEGAERMGLGGLPYRLYLGIVDPDDPPVLDDQHLAVVLLDELVLVLEIIFEFIDEFAGHGTPSFNTHSDKMSIKGAYLIVKRKNNGSKKRRGASTIQTSAPVVKEIC